MAGRPSIDPAYLRYQYDDADKFRVRVDAHRLYSEAPGSFREWLLSHISPAAGECVLDAGCGPGTYHPALGAAGVSVTACDTSAGMLREALAQSAESGCPVHAVRATIEALPFRDALFDLTMANHMLYHVANQRQALIELQRVLRVGGRAIMATNSARNCARIDAVHDAAARSLGFTSTLSDALRFTLDDLPLVRSVFPNARVREREDAFVFPDAASAVRYYASSMIDAIEDRPPDGSHRPRLASEVHRRIDEIVEQEGSFRVPKAAGCFIATRQE
jgi:ubiquinone/menaquinone biosynthesis C-methylase UbiE